MRTQIFVTAGLALALSAPAALAYWSGHGAFEPDYPADVSDGFMFPEPDWDANPEHQQVYFNAFVEADALSVNPNVGALQSRVLLPDFAFIGAYLGAWKDCNKDGYIGHAESALHVYNSVLLIDPLVCPAGTTFNADGWVTEFRWIGPADNAPFPESGPAYRNMINDTAARVWGDLDLAGGQIGESCFVNPQTGTFSGTGALLAYADCNTGYAIAQAITDNDPTGLLGFDNPRQPQCSDSLLNVRQNVFNDEPKCPSGQPGLLEQQPEDDRQAAFTAFDCSAGSDVAPLADSPADQDVSVTDPTSEEELATANPGETSVFVPSTSSDPGLNPTGSYFEGANNTWNNVVDGCEPGGAPAPGPFAEFPVTSDSGYKRETDFTLYFEGSTAANSAAASIDLVAILGDALLGEGGTEAALGPADDVPADGGQGVLFDFQGLRLGPMWSSFSGFAPDPGEWLIRGDGTPRGPTYLSFYASITPDTALTLPGAGGFYASEWCDDPENALELGFDCDAANWWDEGKGASARPSELWTGRALGAVPGDAYNLRDIDCYDGTATSLVPELRGVGLGLSILSETEPPCAYYSP